MLRFFFISKIKVYVNLCILNIVRIFAVVERTTNLKP